MVKVFSSTGSTENARGKMYCEKKFYAGNYHVRNRCRFLDNVIHISKLLTV